MRADHRIVVLVGADNMWTLVHFLDVGMVLWTELLHNWRNSKPLLTSRLGTDGSGVKKTRLPLVLVLFRRLLYWSIFVRWERCIE